MARKIGEGGEPTSFNQYPLEQSQTTKAKAQQPGQPASKANTNKAPPVLFDTSGFTDGFDVTSHVVAHQERQIVATPLTHLKAIREDLAKIDRQIRSIEKGSGDTHVSDKYKNLKLQAAFLAMAQVGKLLKNLGVFPADLETRINKLSAHKANLTLPQIRECFQALNEVAVIYAKMHEVQLQANDPVLEPPTVSVQTPPQQKAPPASIPTQESPVSVAKAVDSTPAADPDIQRELDYAKSLVTNTALPKNDREWLKGKFTEFAQSDHSKTAQNQLDTLIRHAEMAPVPSIYRRMIEFREAHQAASAFITFNPAGNPVSAARISPQDQQWIKVVARAKAMQLAPEVSEGRDRHQMQIENFLSGLLHKKSPQQQQAIKEAINEKMGWNTGQVPSEFSLHVLDAVHNNQLDAVQNNQIKAELSPSLKHQLNIQADAYLVRIGVSRWTALLIRPQVRQAFYNAAKAVLDPEIKKVKTSMAEIDTTEKKIRDLQILIGDPSTDKSRMNTLNESLEDAENSLKKHQTQLNDMKKKHTDERFMQPIQLEFEKQLGQPENLHLCHSILLAQARHDKRTFSGFVFSLPMAKAYLEHLLDPENEHFQKTHVKEIHEIQEAVNRVWRLQLNIELVKYEATVNELISQIEPADDEKNSIIFERLKMESEKYSERIMQAPDEASDKIRTEFQKRKIVVDERVAGYTRGELDKHKAKFDRLQGVYQQTLTELSSFANTGEMHQSMEQVEEHLIDFDKSLETTIQKKMPNGEELSPILQKLNEEIASTKKTLEKKDRETDEWKVQQKLDLLELRRDLFVAYQAVKTNPTSENYAAFHTAFGKAKEAQMLGNIKATVAFMIAAQNGYQRAYSVASEAVKTKLSKDRQALDKTIANIPAKYKPPPQAAKTKK